MEYAELGNLHSYLRSPFSERDTAQIILQVLRGLLCMHAAGYAHRDLKPANLLVFSIGPRWHVKIADFGLSKRVLTDLTSLRTNAGTQGFMAPEMLGLGFGEDDSSDEDTQQSYTNAVDIWAVGVITYLLLTGEMPFSPSEPRALGRYARGKTSFPIQALIANRVGQEAQTMIKSLVALRPSERPTSDASIKHIWLNMSVPLEGSKTVQDVPSAQWTAESQDSGYHGQNTLPTVGTQILDTPQRPENGTQRPSFNNREGASTLMSPKIAPQTHAIPMRPTELPAVPGQHQGAGEVNVWAHMGRNNYWKSYEMPKRKGYLTEMVFSGDRQLMASAIYADESDITFWDVATSEQPIRLTSLAESWAYGLRFSQNGQRFIFASRSTIMVYDLRKPSKPMRVDSIELAITGDEPAYLDTRREQLALSPDGQVLVYPNGSAGLKLRNLSQTSGDRTLEMPAYWEKHGPQRVRMKNLMFSPDGRLICAYCLLLPGFIGSLDGDTQIELLLWDAASCQLLVTNDSMTVLFDRSQLFRSSSLSVAFSPDGELIAIGHGNGATLGSVATLQIVKTLRQPAPYWLVYSLAFRPDGRLIAVMMQGADREKSATVSWDLSTGTSVVCALEAETEGEPGRRVVISPDGMNIATIDLSSNKLWRLKESR
ncbi:Serine/threonine-protein kinase H1 [Elasticomyces elasticus]|nr:Serine/threonine-protein kinase H1 [Elasticomyces elasticus]